MALCNVLLIIMILRVSAVSHTVEYRCSVITLRQCTAVGLLDGEEFMYYDSDTARMIPKTEWIKKVETDSSYWEKETRDVEVQQDWLKYNLKDFIFNQGGNTLQRVYGCEIDNNGVTSGYDKSIYNGKDFISLDLNTGTWTAVDERAKRFTQKWNPAKKTAGFWKAFVEGTCVDRLKSYIPHSTKKEPGTHSLQYSYTAITPAKNVTAIVLLHGKQVDVCHVIPANDPDYCLEKKQYVQDEVDWLKENVDEIMRSFNHTKGVHTVKRTYGCELDDDGTTRIYDRYSYDGEEFITLDVENETWTAVKPQAVNLVRKWESTEHHAKFFRRHLAHECLEMLNSSSNETLDKKGGGSGGGSCGHEYNNISVGLIIAFAILLVLVGAGILYCKFCKGRQKWSRHSPVRHSPLSAHADFVHFRSGDKLMAPKLGPVMNT